MMTGFEYAAAFGMLYEGQIEAGLRCIADISDRYDGRRRNPFDEAECGHHYARAMISWAAVLALSGFCYSAPSQSMTLAAREGAHFWSTGYAWGTCTLARQGKDMAVQIEVLHGTLALSEFVLAGFGREQLAAPTDLAAGQTLSVSIPFHTRR